MDFFLFLLVNATLFIRPGELVPSIAAWPIYEVLIISCALVSFSRILPQLNGRSLTERPITACVLGLLVAIVLSHLSHFFIWGARHSAEEFLKVVLYYLLFVGTVDTPRRLRVFLFSLVGFTVVLSSLALLQYHGLIDIPSLSALQDWDYDNVTGERYVILRLVSTGIYGDPNDLCMILVVAMAVCVYGLCDRRQGVFRPLWLAPIGLFGYAFALTQSRGGMLALLAGLLALFYCRFGWKKAAAAAVVAVPVLLAVVGGRQADILGGVVEGTGQTRTELWSEGLQLLKQYPVFGVGQGMFAEEVGMVAHNSFLHCFAELGFFGGTLFLAAFVAAAVAVRRAVAEGDALEDPLVHRMGPYVLAIVAGYCVSMLTLSRPYVVPTYMVLGLATAYVGIAEQRSFVPFTLPRFDGLLLRRCAALSVGYIGAIYVFIKVVAR